EDSLEMSLASQIRMSNDSVEIKEIAQFLAGNLNDIGYLSLSLDEAAHLLETSLLKVEEALLFLQGLEPAGIGARDLVECLKLQIERSSDHPRWVKEVVTDHLDDLARGKIKTIAKTLGAKPEEINNAITFIRTLNPKPGQSY